MNFSADTFLLDSDLAQHLYHEVARDRPVSDWFTLFGYHGPPVQVSGPALVQHWLGADPRLNLALQRQDRMLGDAADAAQAFRSWAEGLCHLQGSPWYLEAQLALHHSFGVAQWLTRDQIDPIWEQVQAGLHQGRPRQLPLPGGLAEVHTLYDPVQDEPPTSDWLPPSAQPLRPAFCADQVLALEHPSRWNGYLNRLSTLTGSQLEHFIDLINVLQQRVDRLSARGCRVAVLHLTDPGGRTYTDEEINFLFHKLRLGHALLPDELAKLRSALLWQLMEMYHEQDWVLYLVLGAHPADEGSPLPHLLDDRPLLQSLFRQLDQWDQAGILPRLILHLPGRPALAAHLIGHFPAAQMRCSLNLSLPQGPRGLTQQCHAWLAAGLLPEGMGFTSGAAHPLALVRHDYGRRLLCQWLARQVQQGLMPHDLPWLTQLIEGWTGGQFRQWLG